MKVKEFVEEFKNINNDRSKNMIVAKHKKTNYISYIEKIALCKSIVEKTSYSDEKKTSILLNSPIRYMFFIMTLVKHYYDFELQENEIYLDFDLLNECGLINNIIECIGEKEYNEFQTILEMTLDDFYNNHYSIVASLYSLKEAVSNFSNGFMKGIEESFLKVIEEGDIDNESSIE